MVDLLTFDTEVRKSIVQEITAEDTTHAPSGDAVHDALSEKVDKETGKGLFSGSYNDLTDKPTIPDVSGKLDIAQTSHKGKNVVVDGTSGNISFEDKYSHPSTKQCNYAYTHPSTKQCNYEYVHPSAKQCNASIPADISDLTDNTGIIPEDVSDLTDTQNTPFTPKSHTHGELKNDGTIGTSGNIGMNVVTDNNGKIALEAKPTIPTVPSASTTTPSADTTNGDVGDGTTWARSNHKHPKSSLYAEASHSHAVSDLPTANSITDGDTTHIATVDVIHDYIDEIIGDADDWLTS